MLVEELMDNLDELLLESDGDLSPDSSKSLQKNHQSVAKTLDFFHTNPVVVYNTEIE